MRIKIYTFFYLFIISLNCLGQLKDKYCCEFELHTDCISFLDNNRFIYTEQNCTDIFIGKGIYILNKSNLSLYFSSDTLYNKPKINLSVISPNIQNDDSITLKINIFDLVDKIRIKESKIIFLEETKDNLIYAIEDTTGNTIEIRLPRTNLNYRFMINSRHYRIASKLINLSYSYNVDVFLSKNGENPYNSLDKLEFTYDKNKNILLKYNKYIYTKKL